MTERTTTLASGITLAYETFGTPSDPAVLLLMGLGAPGTWWRTDFCETLADSGLHVVRYDHRDAGRSTHLSEHPVTRRQVVATFLGSRRHAPYGISDLADDAVGLLDALDVGRAHVVGCSMGGMVAQTMAIEHPDRVASLTSIMSTTGRRRVGWQHPRLFPILLSRAAAGRAAYVAQAVRTNRAITTERYREPVDAVVARAGATHDRGWEAEAVKRQMLAVLTQPDRTRALGSVRVPTCVVHGLADPMVHPSGGRATAAAVDGAELVLVPDLGHDLPPTLDPLVVSAVTRTVRRAGDHDTGRHPAGAAPTRG
ncbi:pimeloyl-ACP methyl ester carboxylesterase [Mumia flava]|uniref:Pimeloyl-ACP methyl ester carboxylesterase n=1 Tax=Mumia flava TaxID=1348852 RepID=A0A2M9BFS1_9ACTN|nr:alpha/beta fold hydrolase [Mumia flava]PJJ56789.1 pimeloyl-ACP methyl ester carboxylesterase [Mumia flava]